MKKKKVSGTDQFVCQSYTEKINEVIRLEHERFNEWSDEILRQIVDPEIYLAVHGIQEGERWEPMRKRVHDYMEKEGIEMQVHPKGLFKIVKKGVVISTLQMNRVGGLTLLPELIAGSFGGTHGI